MKNIYLVRHGETFSNIENKWQGEDEVLSPHGEIQAENLGLRLANLDIDVLFSSTMKRALQTSSFISKHTGLKVLETDLLREEKIPSSLIGVSYANEPDNGIREYLLQMRANADDKSWRYEDEENPTERIARAQDALHFLQQRPEQNVLAVSHGNFLKFMILSLLTHNLDLLPSQVFSMARCIKSANTGITVIRERDGEWQLLTWNDHAHFAE
ncbi:hypothetical protein CL655_03865 [bacterium]|mgnify:CR=1 FL=1|nr:hypothetical protein [bacterium]|tara:strand:+ start:6481 stop:7119 length:639 start_codon:yes stop_codon:yes gene_type:complete